MSVTTQDVLDLLIRDAPIPSDHVESFLDAIGVDNGEFVEALYLHAYQNFVLSRPQSTQDIISLMASGLLAGFEVGYRLGVRETLGEPE